MVNDVVPDTIDHKAIYINKPMISSEIKENLIMGLKSGQSIGCSIEELTPGDIAKGKPNAILRFLSELLKVKRIILIINYLFFEKS